jgi:16S rRNA (guanine966-N2)-methyltransferase
MRIVAGNARRMKLKGPEGLPIRPMADRVRQSLFNILGSLVEGANVLDTFAGSGALGIEALSRGADHCVFVEMDPRCADLVWENLEHTRLEQAATMVRADIFHSIPRLRELGYRFDLVFFDPPFKLYEEPDGWPRLLNFMLELSREKLLSPRAFMIAEHRIKESPEALPTGLYLDDRRKYGERALSFFTTRPTATK